MTIDESPVLVVGGRTTGLMMAAELARHGAAVRIIDKSPGIDPHSRATFLHSRTMEILDSLGLARQIVEQAQPMHGIRLYANGRLVGRSEEALVDSPFPRSMALSQAKTERYLEGHLGSFGVTVERNTQLISLDQSTDRVRATLAHADGNEETIETPWLIGCDGAHSTVRHLTEEEFPGEADPYPYLLSDVILEGDHDPKDSYIFLGDGGDLFFFMLDEGRRLIIANTSKGSNQGEPPTLEEMQRIVDERSLPGFRLTDPRWLARFHIHYRLAPHYRHGRTFVAGDAAHIHSPIGGQGLNTGVQDAFNLAWKLALVMRGVVPEAWLDTYEMERRRVAEDVLATTKLVTEQVELFASLSPNERQRLLDHMFVPEGERMRTRRHTEEIDLDYRTSPICIESDDVFGIGPCAGAEVLDAAPLVVEGKTCTFFELLRGSNHRLMLFAAAAEGDTADALAAAESAVKAHGHWIDVFFVAERTIERELPPEVTVIEDPKRSLHRRYGAEGAGLYLIRPDGYVAYRSRRPDGLGEYLNRVM